MNERTSNVFFMKNLCMIFNSECTQVQDELDEMAKGLPIIATGLLEVLPKFSLDFLNYLFSDSVEVKY